ncbi:MAG TPA: glycosyltransferase family 4 protein [Cyclobacteriaceae bacterium]|nr:glycosyltransferase family 4 protein [Cyclobacteriaceae bacterium]
MILLVNQHSVPLFVDVANSFTERNQEIRLFTGYVETGRTPLSKKVKVIKSIAYNRRSKTTRAFSWMIFSVHYFFYLIFCKKPAAIVAVTNPPLSPFITALVAGIRKIPFHITVFDLYPDALMQSGISSSESPIYRAWQKNNRWVFRKPDTIITLSHSMKNAIAAYAEPGKIKVINNWADTEYIRPIDKRTNAFVSEHRLTDKLVVMYAGNMGFTHDLESLLEAAGLLIADKRITFVLIGDGAKRKKLEEIKQKKQLSNVVMLPFQEGDNFPLAMAAGDIGIVTLGSGGEGISVPSKTYVNMAAGLAIIAISPPDSELNRIISHYEIGYVVSPGESQKLASMIRGLADAPDILQQFKTRSRAASSGFTSANANAYVNTVLGG